MVKFKHTSMKLVMIQTIFQGMVVLRALLIAVLNACPGGDLYAMHHVVHISIIHCIKQHANLFTVMVNVLEWKNAMMEINFLKMAAIANRVVL